LGQAADIVKGAVASNTQHLAPVQSIDGFINWMLRFLHLS
jgi:hypothetical protein